VNRRLLRAAQVEAWLVDTGYQSGQVATPEQLAEASGRPAHEIVRLEAVAEQVARAGTSAADFAASFSAALAAASAGAVGLKSIAAYRFGLDFEPSRPSAADVAAAAGRLLRRIDADPAARLDDEVLLRHLIWTGVDTGLPVQFHVGFGDPDVRLHRADPSLMHDFLLATRAIGTPIMLLHCYPHHRQAGYLANVFPHVYMDLGAILNHVGARSAAVLAEALEVTPFHKMLYSSDAFGLPELHYLGALGFRRDLARVTGEFVADGAWSAADAGRVANLVGSANARRVYRLART
jgi:predicted TIM-barrel fold metal-dependent hydrolase